ncbi:DUF2913 family protein [Citrobacter portucalensis]|uniref:DUF2913 family protein n=1 Tax=Citrobacter portucalensis TaxID=1639133 RepID=UPI00288B7D8A|nr:DUF2913 family protein [Citrobacter portucalensis]WNI88012.1 DUF2913 family protein [Citrobacter portucalensis]
MKRTQYTLPPEQTVRALAHFAWCALVALRTAQQDGQALSPLSTHAFLLRWLTVAYKQKRFPRAVAPDIEMLLSLGRNKGPAAGLLHRLEYLWTSCTEPVSAQSDLYRLTYAIEQLKSMGWINAALSDNEWVPTTLYAEYTDMLVLLVRKSELQRHFTEQGQQSASIDFIVVGDSDVIGNVFNEQELLYVIREHHTGWCILALLPAAETPL